LPELSVADKIKKKTQKKEAGKYPASLNQE